MDRAYRSRPGAVRSAPLVLDGVSILQCRAREMATTATADAYIDTVIRRSVPSMIPSVG
jgi:hypothetical protein